MFKTVSDIMKDVGIPESSRTALLGRIKNKWKIKPENDCYIKQFSINNFNKIIVLEIKFKKDRKISDNFKRKEKTAYYQNKNNHLYSRLTNYGGIT